MHHDLSLLLVTKKSSETAWRVWFWLVPLSSDVWPLYCGCLIKFSAFYYTFHFLRFLLLVIAPFHLYIDKKFALDTFSESLLNGDTQVIQTLWQFPFVSVFTGFYCISERSVLAGNSTILMSQMFPPRHFWRKTALLLNAMRQWSNQWEKVMFYHQFTNLTSDKTCVLNVLNSF